MPMESQGVLLTTGQLHREATLLIWRILYRVPRVRIPPPPPKSCLWRFSARTTEIARTAGFIRIFSSIGERRLPVICEQDAADFSVSGGGGPIPGAQRVRIEHRVRLGRAASICAAAARLTPHTSAG